MEVSEIVYVRRKDLADAVRYSDKEAKGSLSDHEKFIGSSLDKNGNPKKGLSIEEERKYLKDLLNVDPADLKWREATNIYWNNIRVGVPPTYNGEKGLMLEIGFNYESTAEAERVAELLLKVSDHEERVAIKEAAKGYPINVENYLLYRYCLVYSRVANDMASIYSSPKIEFYLFSEAQEMNEKEAKRKLRGRAFKAYSDNMDNEEIVNYILHTFAVEAKKLDKTGKLIRFEELSLEQPKEFVAAIKNPDLQLNAMLQEALIAGILRKLPNTETIYFGDSDLLGNSTQEAISFLKSNEARSTTVRNNVTAKLSVYRKDKK